ncbi:hypothetical protein OYC64_015219 [Pagothenia borchgrevinki]|uniref:Uncharacterized protein n=1 Tax=Pagothenia borchgrevinki TaxID=8213 RepID=A0ABD2H4T4_PAGBO
MQDELRAGMINLFHVAYFVVKSERPFTDFPVLVDLNRRTGAKMPLCYHHDKACTRFFVDIYQFIYDPILAEVKSARFFSVMIDGATDKAILEQEIVYGRYLDSTKRPKNVFFSIEHVKRANAKGLYQGFSNFGPRSGSGPWSGSGPNPVTRIAVNRKFTLTRFKALATDIDPDQ